MRDVPHPAPGVRSGTRDRQVPAVEPPDWVAAACQGPIVATRRARWGFRHETWIAELASGETSVVQRRADGSDPTGPDARTLRNLVRSAGLPVPEPRRVEPVDVQEGAPVVVALPFIEGVVAAERLRSRRGTEVVGRRCGEIAARIGTIDPRAVPVPIPRTLAAGVGLRASIQGLLDQHGVTLGGGVRRQVSMAVDRAALELDAVPLRPVHGDLVPVNVLLHRDRLAAVLDLDRMCVAHPLYDAAWFAWVVSFYHPEAAERACHAFARAAGFAATSIPDLSWLWPVQLLERVSEAQDPTERSAWLARLADSVASG